MAAIGGYLLGPRIRPDWIADMDAIMRGKDLPEFAAWHHNQFLRSWGAIVGRLLSRQGTQYGISRMYLEFENTASPGDEVEAPGFDRNPASGRPYYDGLADSSNRDYLRVPIIASSLTSSDEELFPDGDLLTLFAQTTGLVGVHGKPFAEGSNSVVFGGALVAAPVDGDATQDLILSRFYPEVSGQIAKTANGQVGVEWEIELQ